MTLPTLKQATFIALLGFSALLHAAPQTIDVYRDPNCGCCSKWMAYLKENGFTVNDHPENNMSAVKEKLGVPEKLGSCHTGVIDGKFVEGHVPVSEIRELVAQKDLIGVAAPGMPMGSPGMESGNRRSAHQIIGVTAKGEERVVADYPAQ